MSNLCLNELPGKITDVTGEEYIILSKQIDGNYKSYKCKLKYVKEFIASNI